MSMIVGCGAPAEESEASTEESGLAYTPSHHIAFLNANLENGSFGESGTDGRNFLAWAAQSVRSVPDIVTLQEMKFDGSKNYHWCSEFADRLSAYVTTFSGLHPNYEAKAPNAGGGTCVLYRAGRFKLVSETPVVAHAGAPCNGGSRMTTEVVKLRDTKSGNTLIGVAALHLPLSSVGGLECIDANLKAVRESASMAVGDGLRIIAGDFNAQLTSYSDLARAGYTRVPLASPNDNSTYTHQTSGRIDFIWVKNHVAYSKNQIVPWEDARFIEYRGKALRYSDHRGLATMLEL